MVAWNAPTTPTTLTRTMLAAMFTTIEIVAAGQNDRRPTHPDEHVRSDLERRRQHRGDDGDQREARRPGRSVVAEPDLDERLAQ